MFKLEISLKRVQTFIFEVPRLKAMLGANALVGQVMRHELPQLLDKRTASLTWPSGISLTDGKDDPLAKASDSGDRDDPAELFGRGILARDGGHFIVVFKTKDDAEAVVPSIEEKLAEWLPGVQFERRISEIPESSKGTAESKDGTDEKQAAIEVHEEAVLDLPVLQVCAETGSGPASPADAASKSKLRSGRSVQHRLKWGQAFYNGDTHDIIGLLHAQLYPQDRGSRPEDLKTLASNGYIALIHADGNGIGKRYNDWVHKAPAGAGLDREAWGEAFFHSMRVAVRRALVTALETTFPKLKQGEARPRKYEVLMLGGDDLLLVCGADQGLAFANNYALALENYLLADDKPLRIALGVAIAQESYPLHRLHALAENLAASAKRLFRSYPAPTGEGETGDGRPSVIDWQVVTQSWFDDVAQARRDSDRLRYTVDGRTETLLLSGKPYPVQGHAGNACLVDLLQAADKLRGSEPAAKPAAGERADASAAQVPELAAAGSDEDGASAPSVAAGIARDSRVEEAKRSPLRSLRGACERGRLSAEMAFARLPLDVRQALGGNDPDPVFWHAVGNSSPPATEDKVNPETEKMYLTRALDIIGIREIANLGSNSGSKKP